MMQPLKDKEIEKSELFFRPSVPKQKTSAEIIKEARSSLRALKTQRPFTPREDQRKLFGPTSSRTPENRPPSSFSLHACNFDVFDSRPLSGARLTPLDYKPKVHNSPTKEDETPTPVPKPPVDPQDLRRVSSGRARLFKAASQGNLLPDKVVRPEECKRII
uniref:Armadillo repeat containing 2 n=1 Tax=Latimeria chalumnae TaxID=7897 RepID=H3BBP4_LATCH